MTNMLMNNMSGRNIDMVNSVAWNMPEESESVPYGAGSVIYNRRNRIHPWEARRYKGRNANGNPNYVHMGSYATRLEAIEALRTAYMLSAEDIQNEELTFKGIFEAFLKDHADEYAPATVVIYRAAYRKCTVLHDKKYKEITSGQMRAVAKQISSGVVRSEVQRLFRAMDKEAQMLGLSIRGEAQFLSPVRLTSEDIARKKFREPFADEEVLALLEHEDEPWMFIPLILLYTGLRQGELRRIKKENVDLNSNFFVGGIKTEAGINRRVPIHPAIRGHFVRLMQTPGEYLLNVEGRKGNRMMREDELRKYFNRAIKPYALRPHVPHETRHTFISKLMEMGANDNLIRKLVGHKLPESAHRYYYHAKDEQLMATVMLLWEKT